MSHVLFHYILDTVCKIETEINITPSKKKKKNLLKPYGVTSKGHVLCSIYLPPAFKNINGKLFNLEIQFINCSAMLYNHH